MMRDFWSPMWALLLSLLLRGSACFMSVPSLFGSSDTNPQTVNYQIFNELYEKDTFQIQLNSYFQATNFDALKFTNDKVSYAKSATNENPISIDFGFSKCRNLKKKDLNSFYVICSRKESGQSNTVLDYLLQVRHLNTNNGYSISSIIRLPIDSQTIDYSYNPTLDQVFVVCKLSQKLYLQAYDAINPVSPYISKEVTKDVVVSDFDSVRIQANRNSTHNYVVLYKDLSSPKLDIWVFKYVPFGEDGLNAQLDFGGHFDSQSMANVVNLSGYRGFGFTDYAGYLVGVSESLELTVQTCKIRQVSHHKEDLKLEITCFADMVAPLLRLKDISSPFFLDVDRMDLNTRVEKFFAMTNKGLMQGWISDDGLFGPVTYSEVPFIDDSIVPDFKTISVNLNNEFRSVYTDKKSNSTYVFYFNLENGNYFTERLDSLYEAVFLHHNIDPLVEDQIVLFQMHYLTFSNIRDGLFIIATAEKTSGPQLCNKESNKEVGMLTITDDRDQYTLTANMSIVRNLSCVNVTDNRSFESSYQPFPSEGPSSQLYLKYLSGNVKGNQLTFSISSQDDSVGGINSEIYLFEETQLKFEKPELSSRSPQLKQDPTEQRETQIESHSENRSVRNDTDNDLIQIFRMSGNKMFVQTKTKGSQIYACLPQHDPVLMNFTFGCKVLKTIDPEFYTGNIIQVSQVVGQNKTYFVVLSQNLTVGLMMSIVDVLDEKNSIYTYPIIVDKMKVHAKDQQKLSPGISIGMSGSYLHDERYHIFGIFLAEDSKTNRGLHPITSLLELHLLEYGAKMINFEWVEYNELNVLFAPNTFLKILVEPFTKITSSKISIPTIGDLSKTKDLFCMTSHGLMVASTANNEVTFVTVDSYISIKTNSFDWDLNDGDTPTYLQCDPNLNMAFVKTKKGVFKIYKEGQGVSSLERVSWVGTAPELKTMDLKDIIAMEIAVDNSPYVFLLAKTNETMLLNQLKSYVYFRGGPIIRFAVNSKEYTSKNKNNPSNSFLGSRKSQEYSQGFSKDYEWPSKLETQLTSKDYQYNQSVEIKTVEYKGNLSWLVKSSKEYELLHSYVQPINLPKSVVVHGAYQKILYISKSHPKPTPHLKPSLEGKAPPKLTQNYLFQNVEGIKDPTGFPKGTLIGQADQNVFVYSREILAAYQIVSSTDDQNKHFKEDFKLWKYSVIGVENAFPLMATFRTRYSLKESWSGFGAIMLSQDDNHPLNLTLIYSKYNYKKWETVDSEPLQLPFQEVYNVSGLWANSVTTNLSIPITVLVTFVAATEQGNKHVGLVLTRENIDEFASIEWKVTDTFVISYDDAVFSFGVPFDVDNSEFSILSFSSNSEEMYSTTGIVIEKTVRLLKTKKIPTNFDSKYQPPASTHCLWSEPNILECLYNTDMTSLTGIQWSLESRNSFLPKYLYKLNLLPQFNLLQYFPGRQTVTVFVEDKNAGGAQKVLFYQPSTSMDAIFVFDPKVDVQRKKALAAGGCSDPRVPVAALEVFTTEIQPFNPVLPVLLISDSEKANSPDCTDIRLAVASNPTLTFPGGTTLEEIFKDNGVLLYESFGNLPPARINLRQLLKVKGKVKKSHQIYIYIAVIVILLFVVLLVFYRLKCWKKSSEQNTIYYVGKRQNKSSSGSGSGSSKLSIQNEEKTGDPDVFNSALGKIVKKKQDGEYSDF